MTEVNPVPVRLGWRVLLALLGGGLSVLAHAPFEWCGLGLIGLAVLPACLVGVVRTRSGFLLGLAWGLGAFLAGVSWLYVALNRYGGVPAPLAGLAIVLFCLYLALYPALVAALFVRLRLACSVWWGGLGFAGLWVLGEWARGRLMTGFPWLSVGYGQTPPSPLAGYFPVLGVFGVGLLLALLAAWLGLQLSAQWGRWRRLSTGAPALVPVRWRGLGLAAAGLLLLGWGLGGVRWTTPDGAPVRVSLIQTHIDQGLKWSPEHLGEWLETNARLAIGQAAHSDIVVLPETTLPLLADQLPAGYLDLLAGQMRMQGSDLVFGVFMRDEAGRIFNSAMSVGVSPTQSYAKHHLVPFGEYSPPLFGWFYRLAEIPMSDQSPGAADQPPLYLQGQRVAVNICYEDVFGHELIRALPEATLMLNLSNLAWYGRSLAQPQHLQIARARAMEAGRPMLRATNTGMTALVQPDGSVQAVLAQFEQGVLQVSVQGYQGLTPYARWGDSVPLSLALFALLLAGWRRPGGARAANFASGGESQ